MESARVSDREQKARTIFGSMWCNGATVGDINEALRLFGYGVRVRKTTQEEHERLNAELPELPKT